MDRVSREERSRIMGLVKGTDTGPEITVRKILHADGFRFRLHADHLPGKPDIVLPKWRSVIRVHGCFWHQHSGCPRAARPTSNVAFWNRKLDRNVQRDKENRRELIRLGWRVVTLWECQIKDTTAFRRRLRRLLLGSKKC